MNVPPRRRRAAPRPAFLRPGRSWGSRLAAWARWFPARSRWEPSPSPSRLAHRASPRSGPIARRCRAGHDLDRARRRGTARAPRARPAERLAVSRSRPGRAGSGLLAAGLGARHSPRNRPARGRISAQDPPAAASVAMAGSGCCEEPREPHLRARWGGRRNPLARGSGGTTTFSREGAAAARPVHPEGDAVLVGRTGSALPARPRHV